MTRSIGSAADFYRIRTMRVSVTDEVDFEWRDDILYRRPSEPALGESDSYSVEAVLLDDEDVTTTLATFEDPESAREWVDVLEDDLAVMTRSQFEDTYFPT